jgi:hypothetical protein
MDKWSLPSDMWITMENGERDYTLSPLKSDTANMPPDPPSPFRTIFHTPINRLKVAFRAQSKIGGITSSKGD